MGFFVCVFIGLAFLLGASYLPRIIKFGFELWNGGEEKEKVK